MKRRDFIKLSAAGVGATLIPVKMLHAADQDKPKVDVNDPQAQALEYVETSSVEGEYCNNCIHATGDLDAEWVGCNLFPGKLVKGEGWCNVWAARP